MKKLRFTTAAVVVVFMAAPTAACGGGGGRVVKVEMTDNAFNPNSSTASVGETVTFRFTNNGSATHEAFIGDAEAQAEHAETMKSDSGGHDAHGGEGLTLEPGESGELSFTFDEPGKILIGCHQSGHYETGMKATVTVS